jgi:hypothetical protein
MTTTTSDLRGRIDAAENHQLEVAAERDQIAFAALVERNPAAVKKLAALNAELARASTELASLNAAFAEAGRRSAVAEACRRDAEERDDATKALELLDSFEKRGAALDEKFNEAIAEFSLLSEDFRQLERLGFAPTTYALVHSNMRLALKSRLMGTGLAVEHLAPHHRRNFIDVIEGWASHVRARATARLKRNAAKSAA